MNKNISREFAQNYDAYSKENNWSSPNVLFNLSIEYLNKNELLLDIGIGTGLSAEPFKKAGLKIYGLDNSEHMLEICASKNMSGKIKLHDINNLPLPFPNQMFDCIIANGLFHLTGYIESLFGDIKRLLKRNSIFAFTIEKYEAINTNDYSNSEIAGIWYKYNDEYDFYTYKHSHEYIIELLKKLNFSNLKILDFCAFKSISENRDVDFRAYINKLN
jgi:predicted TPR repeat methyltransferase